MRIISKNIFFNDNTILQINICIIKYELEPDIWIECNKYEEINSDMGSAEIDI